MRGYLIDVINQEHKEIEVNNLDDYYKYISCDCFDIPTRKIGDRYFNIICDDEGLLKDHPIVSAIDPSFEPMLVGNLIVGGKTNSEGDMLDLTDEDIEVIKDNIHFVIGRTKEEVKPYMVLTNVTY